MANRALAAKVERARRQSGELAAIEYSKPFYAGHATIGAARARSEETAALVAAFSGTIRKCATRKHRTERVRGGFVADRSTIAPGSAQRAGIRYSTDTTSKLIAR